MAGKTRGPCERLRDTCQKCLTVAVPLSWDDDEGSVLARYECGKCGNRWNCWWDPRFVGVTS